MTKRLRDDLLDGRTRGRFYADANHHGVYRVRGIEVGVDSGVSKNKTIIKHEYYSSEGKKDEANKGLVLLLHEHLGDFRVSPKFRAKD